LAEELIRSVQNLLDSDKGDQKRLVDILNTLKQGATLYLSDYKYIESLTSNSDHNDEERQETSESKKRKLVKEIRHEANTMTKNQRKTESLEEFTSSENEDVLMILRTRLANGEITIDEFRSIKKTIKNS
jgi:uncharacterized membrane protein YukC